MKTAPSDEWLLIIKQHVHITDIDACTDETKD
jgi:hypothetical protein